MALGCSKMGVAPLSFSQQTTFTHTYNSPGVYKVTITVKNDMGNSATATASVSVVAPVCGLTGCGPQL